MSEEGINKGKEQESSVSLKKLQAAHAIQVHTVAAALRDKPSVLHGVYEQRVVYPPVPWIRIAEAIYEDLLERGIFTSAFSIPNLASALSLAVREEVADIVEQIRTHREAYRKLLAIIEDAGGFDIPRRGEVSKALSDAGVSSINQHLRSLVFQSIFARWLEEEGV